jgi:hypothetical protein
MLTFIDIYLLVTWFQKLLIEEKKKIFFGPVNISLVRKDMDVNEYERLSNFTLRHKLK